MKFLAPMYYKSFHCIAEKCKNNCCAAGWEIDIDDKTANYYANIPGDFGQKLKDNIVPSSDGTGTKSFKLNENNNCPFWNKNHLCDICINLGEDHLCNICAEHPRFYEWFDGVKEAGVGLCCEEACRIVLSQADRFSTYETEIPYEEFNNYNKKLYAYLLSNRSKIISHIDNATDISSLNFAIRNVLLHSYTMQQNIDFDLLDGDEFAHNESSDIPEVTSYSRYSIIPILEFLTHLEPNDEDWPNYVRGIINTLTEYSSKSTTKTLENDFLDFITQNPTINTYLKNIAIYYIWRYFLKGTFDEEILSKSCFMAISIAVLRTMFFCKWLESKALSLDDCIDITRRYSEEIEYSEDNLFKIAEACYENIDFNVEHLIGLF